MTQLADDVRTLVDFHYWARDRMLVAVRALAVELYERALGGSFPSVKDTLGHLYMAEWAWNERWHGRSPAGPPPAFASLAALEVAWTDLEPVVRGFVAGLDEASVARVVEYRLLAGTPGSATIGQMVQHMVNHATYHRGQVTTLLRQLGAAPPEGTDLITYVQLARSR
jgi:uncharacterized damage-inducible protein DinB